MKLHDIKTGDDPAWEAFFQFLLEKWGENFEIRVVGGVVEESIQFREERRQPRIWTPWTRSQWIEFTSYYHDEMDIEIAVPGGVE